MKKFTTIILLVVLLFTFSACSLVGGNGGNGGDGGNEDPIPPTPEEPVTPPTDDDTDHKHSFSSVWSKDETHHWHAATCGHDVVQDKDVHDFQDGKCTVCNADAPGVPHEHEFSDGWSSDDTHHWHAATCEHSDLTKDKNVHKFVDGRCTVCQALDPNQPSYPYEFGDEVSINNKNFYKDYSDEEKQLYYMLWSENTTVSIKVDITPYELSKINEAYDDYKKGNTLKADTYRKCNLTIIVNDVEYYYEEVGIRMRGNTSRAKFLDSKGNVNYYVHFRFSLSETFDGEEYQAGSWGAEIAHDWTNDAAGRAVRKDRSFATMEKFYYKWNKNYDQTYIREVYANRMFQAYGILTPHITLTQFQMKQNGVMENFGVGNLYETVDKAFIKRNMGKERKGGDLYKCGYGSGFGADFTEAKGYGVETPTQKFTYSLKTNDDRTAADYSHNAYLKAFIEMLKTDKNASNFKTKLEAMVDMDYFTRLEAVNYLLGNPDCIRNNKNNFYIYFVPVEGEDKSTSKAYIIPYDYDRCLGANMDWNPNNGMVEVTPYVKNGGVNECTNPLYTKTILEGGRSDYKAMYKAKIQEVLAGEWFKYANYKKLYDAYAANYSSVAMPSETIQNQCGNKLKFSRFVFSETEGNNIGSWEDNLTVSLYFSKKRATASNNL